MNIGDRPKTNNLNHGTHHIQTVGNHAHLYKKISLLHPKALRLTFNNFTPLPLKLQLNGDFHETESIISLLSGNNLYFWRIVVRNFSG